MKKAHSFIFSLLLAAFLSISLTTSVFAQKESKYEGYESLTRQLEPNDAWLGFCGGSHIVAVEKVHMTAKNVVWLNGVLIPRPLFPDDKSTTQTLNFKNLWYSLQVTFDQKSNLFADWDRYISMRDSLKKMQELGIKEDEYSALKNAAYTLKHRLWERWQSENVSGTAEVVTVVFTEKHTLDPRAKESVPNSAFKVFYGVETVGSEDDFTVSLRVDLSDVSTEMKDAIAAGFQVTTEQVIDETPVYEVDTIRHSGWGYGELDNISGSLKKKSDYAAMFEGMNFGNFKPNFFLYVAENSRMICVEMTDSTLAREWLPNMREYVRSAAIQHNIGYPFGPFIRHIKLSGKIKVYQTETKALLSTSYVSEDDDVHVEFFPPQIGIHFGRSGILFTKFLD